MRLSFTEDAGASSVVTALVLETVAVVEAVARGGKSFNSVIPVDEDWGESDDDDAARRDS